MFSNSPAFTELKSAAESADQGIWSISQGGVVETNHGLIICENEIGDDHVPNQRYISAARPEIVLALLDYISELEFEISR